MGLKAIEELAKLETERGIPGYVPTDGIVTHGGAETIGGHGRGSLTDGPRAMGGRKEKRERVASNEMCTFLTLNISSLQLISVNMIAYRSQYGSVNQAGIIAPAIVAIKTIEILNVMVFKRHLRKNNAAFSSIEEGDSFNDGFKLEFCDGINVLIGENGVGKISILKMIYAATQWSFKQTEQGKTKRLIQFFSNSLKDNDALKNAENNEDYCFYKISDGTHSFEEL